jgi:hypothetical protein
MGADGALLHVGPRPGPDFAPHDAEIVKLGGLEADLRDMTVGNGAEYPMQRLVLDAIASLPDGVGNNDAIERTVVARLSEADRAALDSDPQRRKPISEGISSAKSNLKRAGKIERVASCRWGITVLGRTTLAGRGHGGRRHQRALQLIEVWGARRSPLRSDLGLRSMAPDQLVAVYAEILDELKGRSVIRTDNLVGEYAERLVAAALHGALAPPSCGGFDVETETWGRVQVKARRVTDPADNSKLELGTFRCGPDPAESFTYLAVVLFDRWMGVGRAVLLPAEVVRAHLGSHINHVNGRVLHATDRLMFHDEGKDITVCYAPRPAI